MIYYYTNFNFFIIWVVVYVSYFYNNKYFTKLELSQL